MPLRHASAHPRRHRGGLAAPSGELRLDAPPDLLAQPRPALWLRFDAPDRIVYRTGKVELGQGILAALALILAEELCVDPAQVRVLGAATAHGPNEGYTAGSLSVEHAGAAARYLGALMRMRLATLSGEGVEVLRGVAHRQGAPTGDSYWRHAERLLGEPVPAGLAVVTIDPSRHVVVGRAFPRPDLAAKLRGGGFIHDMVLPAMRHVAFLHPPTAAQTLVAFDAARYSRRHPGSDLIRLGDAVACVTDREDECRDVARTLRECARWSAAPDFDGQDDVAAWLMRHPRAEVLREDAPERPAPTPGLAVEHTWTRPFLAHASIGLCCALARLAPEGVLTVWTHSQGVFALRDQLARVLDRQADTVEVTHVAAAGCYGHNGADDAAFEAALAATLLPGKAIRVQWTRADELGSAPFGAAMAITIAAGLDPSTRRIASWQAELVSTSHGSRPGMHGAPNFLLGPAVDRKWRIDSTLDVPEARGGGASRNARPIYDVGSRSIRLDIAATPVRSSALRSLGAHANVFAIEGTIDELAALAGEDAAAFRRRHLSDPRAVAVLDAVLEQSGWNSRGSEAPDATTLGLGLARYKGRGAYAAVVAEIALDREVEVRRVWCAVDAGLVVDPGGARNQIEGGIVQSISWTLLEAVRFDESGPAARGWADYPILRFAAVPVIETRFVGCVDAAPLGVGEAAQGPTAAAIGNAVSRAIGARITRLPIDRARLLATLVSPG